MFFDTVHQALITHTGMNAPLDFPQLLTTIINQFIHTLSQTGEILPSSKNLSGLYIIHCSDIDLPHYYFVT